MARIAVSGVTSYTGMCIAEACAVRGHEVVGLSRAALASYGGQKRRRLQRVERAGASLVGGLAAEHDGLAAWVRERELDIWIHHHHPMERFRASDYDTLAASAVALRPLEGLVAALSKARVRLLIYSGTYFEPGEGAQAPHVQVTPYARLKGELSQKLRELCAAQRVGFAKVVIPAPSGALENADRLTPQLIAAATSGQPFALRSPESVMDVLPGETLGQVYARAAEQARAEVFRPSGGAITALDWAERVRSGILRRLGLADAFTLQIPARAQRPQPVSFRNPEDEQIAVDWEAFADAYADEWRRG